MYSLPLEPLHQNLVAQFLSNCFNCNEMRFVNILNFVHCDTLSISVECRENKIAFPHLFIQIEKPYLVTYFIYIITKIFYYIQALPVIIQSSLNISPCFLFYNS
jgi:hypothetical protein